MPDGTKDPKRKTFYFRKDTYTKTEVQYWKKQHELDFKDRSWQPWDAPAHITQPTQLILSELIESYKKRIKRTLAASTYAVRCTNLDLFVRLAGEQRLIENITAKDTDRFINASGIKLPTRKNRKKALAMFFKWVTQYYDVNPPSMILEATTAERKHYQKKQHKSFVTEKQLSEIVEHIPGPKQSRHDRALLADFYRLAFYSTRRRSELLSLKSGWITDGMLRLGDSDNLPKSQMIEFVPLPDPAIEIITRLKQNLLPDDKLFPGLKKQFVTHLFRKALKATYPELVGKVSLHNLRDSGIMHLLYVEGMSMQNVMEITGHSTVRSLELYMHRWAKITYQHSLKSD